MFEKKIIKCVILLLLLFGYTEITFANCKIRNLNSGKEVIKAQNCLIARMKNYENRSAAIMNFMTNVNNAYLALREEEVICTNYLRKLKNRKEKVRTDLSEEIILNYESNLASCADKINALSKDLYKLIGKQKKFPAYHEDLRELHEITHDQYNNLIRRYQDAIQD